MLRKCGGLNLFLQDESESEEEGDLFRPRQTESAERPASDMHALDAVDSSGLPQGLDQLKLWEDSQAQESLRNRFVTGPPPPYPRPMAECQPGAGLPYAMHIYHHEYCADVALNWMILFKILAKYSTEQESREVGVCGRGGGAATRHRNSLEKGGYCLDICWMNSGTPTPVIPSDCTFPPARKSTERAACCPSPWQGQLRMT
jgi:hypothetical protein